MKATLTFNLPDDNSDFLLAQRGKDYYSYLWDLDQDLRSWLKHGHQFKSIDEALERIREELHEQVNFDGIE